MNIGMVIKQLRLQQGWSQEQLADRCCISEVSMSRIETGRQGVNMNMLKRTANLFGLHAHQLMAMAEGVVPYPARTAESSTEEARLLDCFRRLSVSQRRLYLELGTELASTIKLRLDNKDSEGDVPVRRRTIVPPTTLHIGKEKR